MTHVTPPLLLIFGSVDPSGADGLTADAVTCARLGCHALATVTALTVQDTAGVEEIQPVSPELLDDQARCVLEDMAVQAIKVGGIYSTEVASAIAQIAADYNQVPLVLQLGTWGSPPTDAASQDDDEDILLATLELLLPQTDVAVVKYSRLLQWVADGYIDSSDQPSPMHALMAAGAEWVLVLDAPVRPGYRANMLLGPNGHTATWPLAVAPERSGDAGAALSCALAALLARGVQVPDAVEQALAYTDLALASSFSPGMGRRIPNRFASS